MNPRLWLVVVGLLVGCRSAAPPAAIPAAPPTPPDTRQPAPAATRPATPVVRTVAEPLTLSAWVEPAHLPAGGGSVEVFIRVRREGGEPYPDVDVQIATSRGDLESQGRILSSDAEGMARDRLETRRTATLTINAGGTIYRFPVPVLPPSADPG